MNGNMERGTKLNSVPGVLQQSKALHHDLGGIFNTSRLYSMTALSSLSSSFFPLAFWPFLKIPYVSTKGFGL